MYSLRPTLDLLLYNLHFNKIPQVTYMHIKFFCTCLGAHNLRTDPLSAKLVGANFHLSRLLLLLLLLSRFSRVRLYATP